MIEVSVPDFVRAVRIAAPVIERFVGAPMLASMLLRREMSREAVVVEATDLDMTVAVAVPCDSPDDALAQEAIILPAPRAVASAVGTAGGKTASFEPVMGARGAAPDDMREGYRVRCGGLLMEGLHGLSVDDWLGSRCASTAPSFSATLNADIIRQLERISSAISREETRYYLNGIAVSQVSETTCRLQATDGHRLMIVDVPLPDADGEVDGTLILPRKFVEFLVRQFRRSAEPMRVGFGLGPGLSPIPHVAVAGKVGALNVSIVTCVLDGTFPDTTSVTDQCANYVRHARCKVTELRRALLAVTARQKMQRLVSLTFSPGNIDINFAEGADGIAARHAVAAEHNVADGWQVVFNARYLLEMLAAIRGDEVALGFSSARDATGAPMTVRDPADPDFLGVLMPMKL